jgi:hypothetical protein
MAKTLSYKKDVQGWTSFYSYDPEWIENLNDDYFTFKDGQIYIHHQDKQSRNTFYSESSPSKIEVVANDGPSETKMFRAIKHEGNSNGWSAVVESEIEKGFINSSSFQKKEDMYYSYIRNYNNEVDTKKLSVQGIGVCTSISQSQVFLPRIEGSGSSVGDKVFKASFNEETSVMGEMILVGYILSIGSDYIEIEDLISSPAIGDFILVAKNQSAESEGVRGYYAKISMTNSSTSPVELYAINAEATKSNL